MQPADADDGNLNGAADARKLLGRDVDGVGLGGRGDERAHAEVVGARPLGGDRLLHGLRGDADDGVGAEDAARLGACRVGLADMHAVGADEPRRLDVVVDQKRDARLAADGEDRLRFLHELFGRHVLLAQLDEGRASRERLAHARGERAAVQPGGVRHGIQQHAVTDILRRPGAALGGRHYSSSISAPVMSWSADILQMASSR